MDSTGKAYFEEIVMVSMNKIIDIFDRIFIRKMKILRMFSDSVVLIFFDNYLLLFFDREKKGL